MEVMILHIGSMINHKQYLGELFPNIMDTLIHTSVSLEILFKVTSSSREQCIYLPPVKLTKASVGGGGGAGGGGTGMVEG